MNEDYRKIKRIKVLCLIFAMITFLEAFLTAYGNLSSSPTPPFILVAILLSLFSLLPVEKMSIGVEVLTALYMGGATTFLITPFVNSALSVMIMIVVWVISFFFIHKYLENMNHDGK